jgi:hypothetical protein
MSERPVPVTCIGCRKVKQCILIQALTPFRDDETYGARGHQLKRTKAQNSYEVKVNLFLCRACLAEPICPLASVILDGV